jgi:hypothetical protein
MASMYDREELQPVIHASATRNNQKQCCRHPFTVNTRPDVSRTGKFESPSRLAPWWSSYSPISYALDGSVVLRFSFYGGRAHRRWEKTIGGGRVDNTRKGKLNEAVELETRITVRYWM